MLFKKKTCEKCQNRYDQTFEECPHCHQKDGNFRKLGIPKEIAWLNIWQQILIFFAGFVYGGYIIYQIIFGLIFKNIYTDATEFQYAVICCGYLAIFITCILICLPTINQFANYFKKWDKYLYGVGYAFTVFAVSTICGVLAQYVFHAETNDNQSAVITYLNFNPLFSLLIMGVIGPICEEFTYRVGLFSFLRRLNRYVAYIVTILVFAFIHFDFGSDNIPNELLNLPSYICAGFIFCLAYEHKGPACSMVAHILYNSASLILTLMQV